MLTLNYLSASTISQNPCDWTSFGDKIVEEYDEIANNNLPNIFMHAKRILGGSMVRCEDMIAVLFQFVLPEKLGIVDLTPTISI